MCDNDKLFYTIKTVYEEKKTSLEANFTLICNQGVTSSNLVAGTIFFRGLIKYPELVAIEMVMLGIT